MIPNCYSSTFNLSINTFLSYNYYSNPAIVYFNLSLSLPFYSNVYLILVNSYSVVYVYFLKSLNYFSINLILFNSTSLVLNFYDNTSFSVTFSLYNYYKRSISFNNSYIFLSASGNLSLNPYKILISY